MGTASRDVKTRDDELGCVSVYVYYVWHYVLVMYILHTSRDRVVGTATCYQLDGPEIESRWRQDFQALGPTQPPILWVSGVFPQGNTAGCGGDHRPPCSAEVKERVIVYVNSTYEPSWPVLR
jgi:hypothetical protein